MLFLNLKKRLSDWSCKHNVEELVRKQLHGIIINNEYIEELSKEQREELYASAHSIFMNPSFKFVIDHLINAQIDETVKRAQNMNDVLFGRGSINGQELIKEEFERLSSLYKEEQTKNKTGDYDKFSVV